ncbi:hypothetical protein DKM44_12960 [Deinococcus irradiatisoli]|uniref:Uncharacterized protein n=1 Tax=Deinococcus irradiatisoli TaxID=2202254 RepID=A0A2Z3JKI7_9DEIO|nr:hypothetical protein [Deinococcus irradiatisoli]AWN24031.1 hypothetical protein DKM44_12960 [Deinococcus irradiatisoli]
MIQAGSALHLALKRACGEGRTAEHLASQTAEFFKPVDLMKRLCKQGLIQRLPRELTRGGPCQYVITPKGEELLDKLFKP